MKEIIDLCYDYNPWWNIPHYEIEEAHLLQRTIFDKVESYIALPQITALVGLRRTGKTTALKQVLAKLLIQNIPSRNILYFPFEESGVSLKKETLEDVLYTYIERILKKKIYEIKEKTFLVLDEVQYIPAWQDLLKRFYDANKNFKFIISGSSSLFIREESKESLAGRILEIHFEPFSFFEFLILKEESPFPQFQFSYQLENYAEKEEEIKEALHAMSEKAQAYFSEYLIKGQFPEAINFPLVTFREYLNSSIWDKVIEKDIHKIYKIEKVEELKQIFFNASRESAELFSPYSWSQEIGIALPTLENYLSYLEKSNLLKLIFNFSKGFRRGPRSLKKIFVKSANFSAAVLGLSEENPVFPKMAGKLAETAVFNKFSELADVYFWRQRDKEIDFIVSFPQGLLPVEVKFKEKINSSDIATLINFCSRKKIKQAVLITKNEIRKEEINGIKIYKIPALAVV